MNNYENTELHKEFLNAMIAFDNLCRKYNLKYCLHGGTCLGAIRHKGFIPWDDDVDIAMLRKDYDKFLRIAQNELGEEYTVQTYKTDSSILTNVTKIRINNSRFASDVESNVINENNNAFLDIFPMSDVPNSKIGQKIQNSLAIFINNIVYAKIGYITPTSKKSKLIYGSLSRLSRSFWSNMLECVIKYFPHFKSKYVNIVATANYCGNTGYATDLWPKKYFEDIITIDFCGNKFYITKYWHEYLTRMYGDYMTPPDINNRNNKHGMKERESV